MEGIGTSDLAKLLPFHKKCSWNVFSHIILKAKLEKSAILNQDKAILKAKRVSSFSRLAYVGFLTQLRNWIYKLEPKKTGKTLWSNYAITHTYTTNEAMKKRDFIAEFTKISKPRILVDLGCNSRDYSFLSLEKGAEYVVGFDYDQTSIEHAFNRARDMNKPFLPLVLDASNPSPNQGWMQSERRGFTERTKSDALLALAFIHHLAIAKNIPLNEIVIWLVNIAPRGVIEFIPKNDSTIVKMLSLREDIFIDYSEDNFELLLTKQARVIKKQRISESGRTLYWYENEVRALK